MRKNTLRILASLLLLSFPVLVSGMGTISVEDIVAGYDTTATVAGVAPLSSMEVHVIAPSGGDTAIAATTNSKGSTTVTLPSRLMAETGDYRVFGAAGRSKITTETTFSVLSEGVDVKKSSMTVSDPFLQADGKSITTVTVTLRDPQGNPLAGRPVQIVGSRPQDRITALSSRETDSSGRVRFAVQTLVSGEIVLRAMDMVSGKVLAGSAHIEAVERESMGGFSNVLTAQLDPSAEQTPPADDGSFADSSAPAETPSAPSDNNIVSAFVVEVSTPTIKIRDVLPLVTVKAVDASGQVVQGFTGTVRIETPNDKNSSLPGYFDDGTGSGERFGKVTFVGKNRGVFPIAWTMSFTKPGDQPILVSNESGTVTGEGTVKVTGSSEIPEGKRISVTAPKDGDTVNSLNIVLEGKGPALRNLKVWVKPGGTSPDEMTLDDATATGDTGAKGSFSIPVKIPDSDDVMLQIQDEKAEYDSGIVTIHVDKRGPDVRYSVTPDRPREGEDVTFTVQSEPDLPSLLLTIDGNDYTLTEVGTGQYQVLFPSPKSGDNAFSLNAWDLAGNQTVVRGNLVIDGPEIPQVQNIRTESDAGGIKLAWDRIPDDTITSYRIQVGKSPVTVDFTLDTPEATDSAAVMGLKAGIDYFLTVSALRGEQQGPKSGLISARTLGIELTVTPQDDSLLLQWNFPDSTPLQSFILEYGPGEDFYSEKRTLEGGMRTYTITDLFSQAYYVRLTPVTTTGQIMSELAVTGTGTPLSGEFHPSAGDALNRPPADVPPPNDLHEGAPATPDSGFPGIPLWIVGLMTCAAAGAYYVRRKRRLLQTQAFLRHMQNTYRGL